MNIAYPRYCVVNAHHNSATQFEQLCAPDQMSIFSGSYPKSRNHIFISRTTTLA